MKLFQTLPFPPLLALFSSVLLNSALADTLPVPDVTATNFIKGGSTSTLGTFEWRSGGGMIAKGGLFSGSLLSSDFKNGPTLAWDGGRIAFFAGLGTAGQTLAYGSASFGCGRASGYYSFAAGNSSNAAGDQSVALGNNTTATGNGALATGFVTFAVGLGASSFGTYTIASGSSSAAFGDYTRANAYASFAIGRYNMGSATEPFVVLDENDNPLYESSGGAEWIGTDPVFEIGNGTPSYTYTAYEEDGVTPYDVVVPAVYSNALTVYKNGNTEISGTLTVQGREVVTNNPFGGANFLGNVGIGTESSTYRLDVNGTSQFIGSDNSPVTGIAHFLSNNQTLGQKITYNGIEAIGSSANASITLTPKGTGVVNAVSLGVNTTNKQWNGVTAQFSVLTAKTSTQANAMLYDSAPQAQGVGGVLAFGGNYGPGQVYAGTIEASKVNSTEMEFGYDMVFKTRAHGSVEVTEVLRLGSSGNVGIGTAGPVAKLHVEGDVLVNGQVRFMQKQGDILMGDFGLGD